MLVSDVVQLSASTKTKLKSMCITPVLLDFVALLEEMFPHPASFKRI